jgi:hypothetical protein
MTGFIVGGAGIAVLGVGATFGILAKSAYGDAEGACPSHKNCSSTAVTAYDRANLRANVANVMVPVGLVAVGVGTALVITAGHSRKPEAERGARAVVVPVVGTRGGAISVSGTF